MSCDRKQVVVEMVRKWPERGNLTLARALYKKFPDLWPSLNACRSAFRTVRGVIGEKGRKHMSDKSLMKRGHAGMPMPEMPKPLTTPWEPFEVSAKTTLVLSDIHVPFHDPGALDIAVKWGVSRNPETVLLNGDIIDFFAISRWLRDPRKVRLREEITSTIQLFDWLRSKFPKAQFIWKHGNHEERWEHYLWQKAPELLDVDAFDIASIFQLERFGIELVKDQRIIMVGKLPVMHGHELPKGMTNPVNQARGQFLRTLECGLAGHGHRTSEHVEGSFMQKNLITNWSTGCLCDMTPEYARINKWNWGFAYVETDKAGAFSVENKRIHRGKAW